MIRALPAADPRNRYRRRSGGDGVGLNGPRRDGATGLAGARDQGAWLVRAQGDLVRPDAPGE